MNQKSATYGQMFKVFIGMFVGLSLLLGSLVVLDSLKVISLGKLFHKSISLPFLPQNNNENKRIAKVGEESIYQEDLATESKNYPNIKSKTDQLLLKKIESDSIILQAGAKEGLVTLDKTIYNSPSKDYNKRISAVASVKKKINDKQSKLTGSFVSIWFYNNSKPTALSVSDPQQAKALALAKITPLYNAVKSKQMSMQQAAEKIKNDTSLAAIDIAYKSNAIGNFRVGLTDKITFDRAFDAKIHALKPGQLTELYLAQDTNIKTKKLVDAMYMFAQVSDRKQGSTDNFAAWFAKQEKLYAITTY